MWRVIFVTNSIWTGDWELLTLSHSLSIMMRVVIGVIAYLAGVGNDPRKHRYFNIEKQAKDYDKDSVLEIYG
jgi:hypothetical protein